MILATACCFDYRYGKIPNELIVSGIMAAALYRLAYWLDGGQFSGAGKEILVLVCWFAFLYLFFALGGLGAGDVKLYMVCLLFLRPQAALTFVFGSMGIGAVFYFLKILSDRLRKKEHDRYVRLTGPMLLGLCLQIYF